MTEKNLLVKRIASPFEAANVCLAGPQSNKCLITFSRYGDNPLSMRWVKSCARPSVHYTASTGIVWNLTAPG